MAYSLDDLAFVSASSWIFAYDERQCREKRLPGVCTGGKYLMAEPRPHPPALLVVAAFSRHEAALGWAAEQLQQAFGPLACSGPTFEFCQTRYYEPTMGSRLRKQLLAFERLVAAEELPAIKLHTNDLERRLAANRMYEEERPLNLDPGLLTLGKFVLATTKDQAHRIYLRDGIFAEVTLRFEAGAYEPWPWTYADYREEGVRATLKEFREFYKGRLRSEPQRHRDTEKTKRE
jgi:hypothetical protein